MTEVEAELDGTTCFRLFFFERVASFAWKTGKDVGKPGHQNSSVLVQVNHFQPEQEFIVTSE